MMSQFTLKLLLLMIIMSLTLILLLFRENINWYVILYNTILQITCLYIVINKIESHNLNYISTANYITYLRLVSVIVLSSYVISNSEIMGAINTFSSLYFVIFSIIIFILDWLDGYFAKTLNEETKFGEHFDQEVDNLLIMVLAISIIIEYDKFFFLLLIPTLRYIFIFTKKYLHWMRRNLYFSIRRKYICGVSIILLISSNLSGLPFSLIELLCIINTLLVFISFMIDVLWLYRRKNEKIY